MPRVSGGLQPSRWPPAGSTTSPSVAASPQTDGVAFTGVNTLTAQDLYDNTITNFNASTNNVTVTAVSPLTGTVSGIHGSNVLNQASDFSSGVANLTTLGMTYTGNANTGTFSATSATGGKTGTSGSVTIAVGALDHFAFVAASPQTNGTAFSGTNTLTAQDVGNNTITGFNASTNNVTVTAVSPLTGAVTFTSGATGDVLNTAGDFSSGVANLTTLGMTYTGNTGTGTFKATSTTGAKTGTSGSVTINPGALASFTFVAASPQTDGVAFSGTNTLTAKDASGNTITGFNASANNVTITPNSLAGAVSFTSGAAGDVLNASGDFTNGVANLTTLGMTYTGTTGAGTFTATSGGKTGTSGSVTIAVGALDHFTVPTPAAQLVSSPSAPNVTASGCSFSCNTTWHYEVTAVNVFGETLPGTSTSVSNASSLGSGGSCNGGFFGTCTNTVTTPSSLPTGATSFNLYRSSGSGILRARCYGLSTSALVTDTGLTAGAAPPTSNTATYPITVGIAFSETITALDVGGNPASGWTSGTNCVKFSGPSSSPSPSSTAPSYGSQGSCASGQTGMAFNASGQATASITLFDAQSTTLMVTSVTAPANKTGTSGSFTVAAGRRSTTSPSSRRAPRPTARPSPGSTH